jgi:hypothetical protein
VLSVKVIPYNIKEHIKKRNEICSDVTRSSLPGEVEGVINYNLIIAEIFQKIKWVTSPSNS